MVKVMEITFGDFCKNSVAAFGGKPHSSIVNGLRRSARRRYDARRFHPKFRSMNCRKKAQKTQNKSVCRALAARWVFPPEGEGKLSFKNVKGMSLYAPFVRFCGQLIAAFRFI
jgi:hypothetical protein